MQTSHIKHVRPIETERGFKNMSSTMTEAGRKAKNAYMKEWRKKNPEKVKATMAAYWDRKAKENDLQAQENAETGKGAVKNDA